MTQVDRSDEMLEWYAEDHDILTRLTNWFGRYIAVTDPHDLFILALWTVHTFLVEVLYTTPRLRIDSTVFGSGKTTVLDHLSALSRDPVQAASLSSPALIPRMLEHKMRTILLDEVDRSLRADKPGVEELIAVLNSGYRVGATRPVLVPTKGGGWEPKDMPTYAPVAMAGNSPNLPPDTVSRELRVLLMPDLDGTVEESDWEEISGNAAKLKAAVASWADDHRAEMAGMKVDLPAKCIGRSKEKWRPLKRIAVAVGGEWPSITDELIVRNLAEDEAEKEAGLKTQPPGMVMLTDLFTIWPEGEDFVSSRDLVNKLILRNPEYWGVGSAYGKPLTDTRMGRLVSQAAKVTSSRPGGRGPRGYLRPQLETVWHRLGISRLQPGAPGEPGEPGADSAFENQVHRDNRVHQVVSDTPEAGAPNGQTGPPRFCHGCGNHWVVHGVHRADCTSSASGNGNGGTAVNHQTTESENAS
jgi:hypothetical protein